MTSGCTDLYSIYVMYIKYAYISIELEYISTQYNSNAEKLRRLTSTIFGMVHSDRTMAFMLHKQTLSVSDFLAFNVI